MLNQSAGQTPITSPNTLEAKGSPIAENEDSHSVSPRNVQQMPY